MHFAVWLELGIVWEIFLKTLAYIFFSKLFDKDGARLIFVEMGIVLNYVPTTVGLRYPIGYYTSYFINEAEYFRSNFINHQYP